MWANQLIAVFRPQPFSCSSAAPLSFGQGPSSSEVHWAPSAGLWRPARMYVVLTAVDHADSSITRRQETLPENDWQVSPAPCVNLVKTVLPSLLDHIVLRRTHVYITLVNSQNSTGR